MCICAVADLSGRSTDNAPAIRGVFVGLGGGCWRAPLLRRLVIAGRPVASGSGPVREAPSSARAVAWEHGPPGRAAPRSGPASRMRYRDVVLLEGAAPAAPGDYRKAGGVGIGTGDGKRRARAAAREHGPPGRAAPRSGPASPRSGPASRMRYRDVVLLEGAAPAAPGDYRKAGGVGIGTGDGKRRAEPERPRGSAALQGAQRHGAALHRDGAGLHRGCATAMSCCWRAPLLRRLVIAGRPVASGSGRVMASAEQSRARAVAWDSGPPSSRSNSGRAGARPSRDRGDSPGAALP